MSNVISLNVPVASPRSSGAYLSTGTTAAKGLLLALATLVARGRDAAELRGLSDHALRDIGLEPRDLGRRAVLGSWDATTGTWTPLDSGR